MICKWRKVFLFISSKQRFILTMWYVNRDRLIEIDCSNPGFILTMWYVN